MTFATTPEFDQLNVDHGMSCLYDSADASPLELGLSVLTLT